MRKKGLMVLTIFVLVWAVYIGFTELTTEPLLTEEEMTQQVEKVYNAVVQNIVEEGDLHIISFQKNGSTYEVALDARNGKMSDLQVIHLAEEQPEPEPPPEPEPQPEPSQPVVLLSEADAINIAVKEVGGTADDVEFEESANGGYYLVDIEQGEEDIIVQIHAITGKILSIQYED